MLIKQYEGLRQQHKDLVLPEPELDALDVNYRSHAGILDVGNAIVAVMRDLSPLTIDRCDLPYRQHALGVHSSNDEGCLAQPSPCRLYWTSVQSRQAFPGQAAVLRLA